MTHQAVQEVRQLEASILEVQVILVVFLQTCI